MPLTEPTVLENDLATQIIACAMIVHKHLGPRLIESVYETCFCHELKKAGLSEVRQGKQPIIYDGITFDDPFRIDILVNNAIIVENKVVETVLPLHKAQLRTYLKLTNRRLGLLINFNTERLKDGISRVVNGGSDYDLGCPPR